MTDEKRVASVTSLIDQFKRAALVTYFGYEDEHVQMQSAGIASAKRVVEALDALEADGRLALLPLLDDPDDRIRIFAATKLLEVTPERAVATLRELRNSLEVDVSFDARMRLWRHGRGE